MMRTLSCLSPLAMLMLPGHAARAALDPEDQKLIDEASCEEIQREYCNYSVADAQESLAELREIRMAIAEGARKKSCRL